VRNDQEQRVTVASIVRPGKAPKAGKLVVGKRSLRLTCSLLLAASDLLTISFAVLAANALYWNDIQDPHGVTVLLTLLPIYVGVASLQQAYDVDVIGKNWGGAFRAIPAFVQAAVAILSLAYFLRVGDSFSRVVFGFGIAGTVVLLPFTRLAVKTLSQWISKGSLYTVVVIRDGVAYEPSEQEIVVTPAELSFDPTTSDPFQFHALADAVGDADRIVVACPQERYVLWSTVLKSMAISGEILPDEHDHLGIIGIGTQGGRQTLIVAAGTLHLNQRILKRTLDLTIAVGSLVLLSPLLIAVAIAIRLESAGPVLFRQERIGQDNRIFRIFKFRSMYVESSDARANQLTTRNDRRVTRVGSFIRRTSIDELPQILNVLRGDMSIVGPRPHPLGAKAADLLYWEVDARYRHRHSIKPGLTGLAQIRGFRGNTERIEDLTNRLHADLEYALNWSMWRDLQIIGRTLLVLSHHNAF
jgi:exopolysaccharide biosynthesis polyprenyl glycosylphosphotransferase